MTAVRNKYGFSLASAETTIINLDYRYPEETIHSFVANISGSAMNLTVLVGGITVIADTSVTVESTVSTWDGSSNLAENIDITMQYVKFTAGTGSAGNWKVLFVA